MSDFGDALRRDFQAMIDLADVRAVEVLVGAKRDVFAGHARRQALAFLLTEENEVVLQAGIKGMQDEFTKLGDALTAGKNDDAAKIVADILALEKKDHGDFRRPDDK